ncbi:MAG: hypothetical protein L6M37_04920 [Candidatus Methylarchaceae archaeon HK02M1]|nr:hypothetical protein [Candidatus Methylarchaceae archaeon HK02M1]
MPSTKEYRERIYIRKDIILKLVQYSSLTQTALLSYCGLNLQKHKEILDGMVEKGLIARTEKMWGSKKITIYKATEKGRQFCRMILEPYEALFPRFKKITKIK